MRRMTPTRLLRTMSAMRPPFVPPAASADERAPFALGTAAVSSGGRKGGKGSDGGSGGQGGTGGSGAGDGRMGGKGGRGGRGRMGEGGSVSPGWSGGQYGGIGGGLGGGGGGGSEGGVGGGEGCVYVPPPHSQQYWVGSTLIHL